MRYCIDCGTPLSANPTAKRCKPCAGGQRHLGMIERTCVECGKTFTMPRSHLKGGARGLYCSNGCRHEMLNRLPRPNKGRRTYRLTTKGYMRSVDGMEHRHVMERELGRKLTRQERVHHVNGDRTDNRIENLKLYASQADHVRAEHPELATNLRHSSV